LPEATWMGSRGPEASRESSVWCAWAAAAETQWPAQRKWRSPRNVRRSPRLSAAPGEVWVVRVSAQSKAI
jgi:hypothetical protein